MPRAALLGALVLLGLSLRGIGLDWPPLWADEAESAVNALSILDRGIPVDHHLGLPLFENTLLRPWPESEEYEFRDMSYSGRGVAIYHGWLPLYSIAGALRLAGVTPEDARRSTPPADSSRAEFLKWTAVPRVPSLLFSTLFILLCFRLGQRVFGSDAGWTMALGATVSGLLVWLGRQARYYSAMLALGAACGLAIWNARRRGRLRDHLLVGLTLGLLFHTNTLSALTMGVVYVACIAPSWRQPRLLPKVALAGAVSGLLVLPWAWWSGFLGQMTVLPPARGQLDLTTLVHSLPDAPLVLATAAVGVGWLLWTLLRHAHEGGRWQRSFAGERQAFGFALLWLAASYTGFVLLVPAASYWKLRLQLAVAVPGLLLITLILTAAARAALPGRSERAAPAAMLGLLLLSGAVRAPVLAPEFQAHESDIVSLLRSWKLAPGGRIYALPNHQLFLTYYTGVPVQSVSAVRREWLERFEGDLIIVENPRYEKLTPEAVSELAEYWGQALPEAEAAERAARLLWLVPAMDLRGAVLEVHPQPPALDDLDRALVAEVRKRTRDAIRTFAQKTPLRQAADLPNWRDFWQFFFYWFSNPEARIGPGLNYARRIRWCRAHVLPSAWIVYDCRGQREPPLVPGLGT